MNLLDWLIVGFVALLALRGLRSGLMVGALSLVGVVAGAYLGSRAAPYLFSQGALVAYGPVVVLVLVLIFALVGEAVARSFGASLRSGIRDTFFEVPDRLGGVLLGATLALALVWVGGILAAQAPLPAALQASVERSRVMGELETRLPSETVLQAFARFDPLPEFEGPRPGVTEPDPSVLDEPVVESVAPSVLQVLSTSEEGINAGSGWVAAPGLVVTNAHVVADGEYVAVRNGGLGGQLSAEVEFLDERNDLAVLSIEDPGLQPLPLAAAFTGEEVAILGYPGGGAFQARPGRIGGEHNVLAPDAFGRGPVERQVTSIRGQVEQGNSGGPVVNPQGQVVATVFAARVGAGEVAYAVPAAVVEAALAEVQQPVV